MYTVYIWFWPTLSICVPCIQRQNYKITMLAKTACMNSIHMCSAYSAPKLQNHHVITVWISLCPVTVTMLLLLLLLLLLPCYYCMDIALPSPACGYGNPALTSPRLPRHIPNSATIRPQFCHDTFPILPRHIPNSATIRPQFCHNTSQLCHNTSQILPRLPRHIFNSATIRPQFCPCLGKDLRWRHSSLEAM